MSKNNIIGIIGLGYVGLPLAIEFGKIYKTIGYDLKTKRINDLKNFIDDTLEISNQEFALSYKSEFTNEISELRQCNFYIVTVPTPVTNDNKPDLLPLTKASHEISKIIKKDDIIIYESTVYPGAVEEVCVPILENGSNLKFNKDFFCGYSPERINPGDKKHKLTNIIKITSGSTPETSKKVDALYKSIIKAGTFVASSIKVAEAAKVIENTQRDVNIALINEFAIIFNKIGIDTEEVLKAAETKWNFLNFKPGLVGGHCIGIDPFYLTYKSEILGYKPKIILSGREINDSMSRYIFDEVLKLMEKKNFNIKISKILIMGLTFKENCPDIRNTKVSDLVNYFKDEDIYVDVFDPWVDRSKSLEEFNIDLIDKPPKKFYDLIILAVPHQIFKEMGIKKIKEFGKEKNIFYDIKYLFSSELADGRL